MNLLNNILCRVSYKNHTERIRHCSWFCKSCIYIWGGQPWSALMSNCQTHQPLNSMLNSGSKHNGNKDIMISYWQCINCISIPTSTGRSHLMRISLVRISLVRISLLRFFKTFHKYLPYANFGLFISLVQFFGQKIAKKITLMK